MGVLIKICGGKLGFVFFYSNTKVGLLISNEKGQEWNRTQKKWCFSN
jgi:hypothetical protein